jgi:crossover junction endodeoxyribonuclease RusA
MTRCQMHRAGWAAGRVERTNAIQRPRPRQLQARDIERPSARVSEVSRHTSWVQESRPPDELIVEFVVPGVPISAQSKNRERLRHWQDLVIQAASHVWTTEPLDHEVAVILVLYGRRYHLDIDNMTKPILDALNGLIWKDDRQVMQALPARRDLFERYQVAGMSETLFKGFATKDTFLHVQVRTPPDRGIPL